MRVAGGFDSVASPAPHCSSPDTCNRHDLSVRSRVGAKRSPRIQRIQITGTDSQTGEGQEISLMLVIRRITPYFVVDIFLIQRLDQLQIGGARAFVESRHAGCSGKSAIDAIITNSTPALGVSWAKW